MEIEDHPLTTLISDISETYFNAGWMIGIEFELWDAINGSASDYWKDKLEDPNLARLKAVSDQLGSWAVWEWGPRIVRKEEFEKIRNGHP